MSIFVIICIFKFLLYILTVFILKLEVFSPLGIYIYFSTNMSMYIHMHVNNFELQQLCTGISGLLIFFKITVDNEQPFEKDF